MAMIYVWTRKILECQFVHRAPYEFFHSQDLVGAVTRGFGRDGSAFANDVVLGTSRRKEIKFWLHGDMIRFVGPTY